jgi:MFS family permease
MTRNIRIVHFYTITCNAVFVVPVVVPYYQHIGLTFSDFLIGEAIFSVMVLLAEVPTGWIADVWNRRSSLILGMVFAVAGYGLLMIAENFWMATAAQGILGIAVAMNSGSVTALLYDTLAEHGKEEEYRRLEGKRHAIGLYAVAGAALSGGFLFAVDPKLPVLVNILFYIAGMVAMSFAIEPARHMKKVEKHPLHDMAETMRYALRGHPEITGIILLSAVIFCTTKMMLWSQQPYYQETGMPVEWFGVIMAGSYLIGGIGGHFSHKIDHWGSNRVALGFIAAALAFSCIVLSFGMPVFLAVPLFLTGTLAYGMGMPRVQNAINARVGGERRATILSTANLMVHIMSVPSFLIAGAVSDKWASHGTMFYIGAQVAVLGGIGLLLWRRNGYKESSTITGT